MILRDELHIYCSKETPELHSQSTIRGAAPSIHNTRILTILRFQNGNTSYYFHEILAQDVGAVGYGNVPIGGGIREDCYPSYMLTIYGFLFNHLQIQVLAACWLVYFRVFKNVGCRDYLIGWIWICSWFTTQLPTPSMYDRSTTLPQVRMQSVCTAGIRISSRPCVVYIPGGTERAEETDLSLVQCTSDFLLAIV